MHKIIASVFAIFLLASAGYAQVPSGNVFVGYSYMSADLISNNRTKLNGWNGSVEGKVLPFIGLVADFSGCMGPRRLFQILLAPGLLAGRALR